MGLYALQHRGQESVGVVSIDDAGNAVAFRRMGTMTDGMAHEMERLVATPTMSPCLPVKSVI